MNGQHHKGQKKLNDRKKWQTLMHCPVPPFSFDLSINRSLKIYIFCPIITAFNLIEFVIFVISEALYDCGEWNSGCHCNEIHFAVLSQSYLMSTFLLKWSQHLINTLLIWSIRVNRLTKLVKYRHSLLIILFSYPSPLLNDPLIHTLSLSSFNSL